VIAAAALLTFGLWYTVTDRVMGRQIAESSLFDPRNLGRRPRRHYISGCAVVMVVRERVGQTEKARRGSVGGPETRRRLILLVAVEEVKRPCGRTTQSQLAFWLTGRVRWGPLFVCYRA